MTRLALFLLLLLPLAACDSADPGPEAASISIALGAITANSNCDSATNPGDFQFLIEVTDLGNNPIEAITLPENIGGLFSRFGYRLYEDVRRAY